MTCAVAFPVLVSIASKAAFTWEPDPLISIAFVTVMAPVDAVFIVVMSVAVMSVVAASEMVTVPVCVVTVPANAAVNLIQKQ